MTWLLLLMLAADVDAAREQLIRYLNGIANTHLAQRKAAVAKLQSRSAVEQRQAAFRAKVTELIGGLPAHSGPVAVKEFGSIDGDGFKVLKIAYESLPNFWVTANVYVPDGFGGPYPAVIIAPGHGAAGKTEDWSWGVNFARNGIVAMAYDPLGQGERLQYWDAAKKGSLVGNPTGEHGEANIQAMLIGDNVARYMINDAMRGLDYLAGRKNVNADRLGAFGCSGGGTATAYLAALDPRVKAAATACYITSFGELLPSPTGVQDAEQTIPHFIENNYDLADWVEAFAPKPYAIISTTEDMFPFAGAKQSYEEAKRIYSLFGAEDKLQWFTGPGGHGAIGPMGPKIIRFFTKNLKMSDIEPDFTPMKLEDRDSLRCTPTGHIDGETVYSLNKKRADEVIAKRPRIGGKELEAAIRGLAGITAVPGGAAPRVEVKGSVQKDGYRLETILMDTVPGILIVPDPAGAKPAVLVLGGVVEPFLSQGRVVLALASRPTPAGTESIKSPYLGAFNLLSLRAFTVGKTILGLRVDDAIHAMDLLCARKDVDRSRITVHGAGAMGMVALHAAVLDSRIGRVEEENGLGSYRAIVDEPLHRGVSEVVIPGVLRKYDTEDLVRAILPRVVVR